MSDDRLTNNGSNGQPVNVTEGYHGKPPAPSNVAKPQQVSPPPPPKK